MQQRQYATLYINGARREIGNEQAFLMLADYLRYELQLCGTKIVCAEGDCGACTVLCARKDQKQFVPINACITLTALLDGCHIVTVEAIQQENKLSPVQEAMVTHHGSQCGYCTPGFVMAMTALFEKPRESLSEQKIKNSLTGNLCRCTGYQPIVEAALAISPRAMKPLCSRFSREQNQPKGSLHIISNEHEFYAPTNIESAVEFRAVNADARIIAGATDLGVLLNKGRIRGGRYLSLMHIEELRCMSEQDGRIIIGALTCLSDLRTFLKQKLPAFSSFLNIFASLQIKNLATLVGNVANGSPIADTVPFLMVTDGKVHVQGANGSRIIDVTNLYQGYKTLSLDSSEIITHISFLSPESSQNLCLEKVSQRRDLDIAVINLAMLTKIDEQNRIKYFRMAIGGVSKTVMRLFNVENILCNQKLSREVIDQAATQIAKDIKPQSDLRGSVEYRHMLVNGLFRRYLNGLLHAL